MRNIVYSCNDNYVMQTIVSITSLLQSNSYPVRIWIVSDHISAINKSLILEKLNLSCESLIFLDIDIILAGIPVTDGTRHPRTIYAKLFLSDVIKADKILYLDSDTIINGDLTELWERDMRQELVAGVLMPYSQVVKEKVGVKKENPYLCDGVVLINMNLWKKYNIQEICKNYLLQHKGAPFMLSEGILNYVCQGKVGKLHPKFNVMPHMLFYEFSQLIDLFCPDNYYSELQIEEACEKPIIEHYVKELYNRPWLKPCNHPKKGLYRELHIGLFGAQTIKWKRQEIKTYTTKLLYKILPFRLYVILYHFKNKI